MDRWHFAAISKVNLEIFGSKRAVMQLLPKLLHDHIQFLRIAGQKIGDPLRLQFGEMFGNIIVGMLSRNFQCFLNSKVMKTALFHYFTGCFLQNIMYICTVFRRIYCRRLPLPNTKTVLQEIAHPTIGKPIHLRGRQPQFIPVKTANILIADRAVMVSDALCDLPINIL